MIEGVARLSQFYYLNIKKKCIPSQNLVLYTKVALFKFNIQLRPSGLSGVIGKVISFCEIFLWKMKFLIKQQLSQMYFDDEIDLLKNLNDDWSTLLKNIKQRQEMHYRLLQNNQNIVSKQRSCCDIQEDNGQALSYKSQLIGIVKENHQLQHQQKQIVGKYENNATSSDAVVKLMSRVAANVVEITELSLDKLRKYDHSLEEKARRMKRTLIGLLSSKQKLNLQHLINVILDYSKSKMQGELFKFEQLTKALESKEFNILKEIYYPQQKPRASSVQKIRELMIERRRDYSHLKEERDSVKKRSLKKVKTKILCNLYSIMLLSKHQWNEQYQGTIQEKKQKAYNELIHRNRINQEHIRRFSRVQDEFHEKVLKFQQILRNQTKQVASSSQKPVSKEILPSAEKDKPNHMQKQRQQQSITFVNNSCTQALMKKPKPPLAQSIMFNDYLATEVQNYNRGQQQDTLQQDPSFKKKMFITRSRFPVSFVPKQNEDFPQIFNKTIYTQHNDSSHRFQSIKKETSYEASKGKLPDINRGTSFDNKFSLRIPKPILLKGGKEDINNMQEDILRTNKRRDKWFREEKVMSQRTKISMKNVEVGIDFNSRRQQSQTKRQQTYVIRQRKKTDITGIDSTGYCKRTITKFIDSKLNVFL